MNLIILMLLMFNLSHHPAIELSSIQPQSDFEKLTVDLTQCKPATRNLSWGLGSESVTVKGRRRNKCILQQTSEIEGGYSIRECRLPISLGKLIVSQVYDNSFNYSFDVSKYCKVIKSGNVFWETKPK